jgi:hypothetical protein
MSGGYMGKILVLDLASGEYEQREFSAADQRKFLGNKILGAKLLLELVPEGADPLGEDNILAITTGPLTGSGAPTSARFNATTKSPLTGAIGTLGPNIENADLDSSHPGTGAHPRAHPQPRDPPQDRHITFGDTIRRCDRRVHLHRSNSGDSCRNRSSRDLARTPRRSVPLVPG